MKAPARTPPSAPRADDGASRPPACNEGGNHQLSRGTTSHSEATFDDCLPHQLKRRMQRQPRIWFQSVSNLVPIWVPICVHLVRQTPRHTTRHRGRGEQVNSERLLLLLRAQLHPQADELVELVARLEARVELGGALRQTSSGEIRSRRCAPSNASSEANQHTPCEIRARRGPRPAASRGPPS